MQTPKGGNPQVENRWLRRALESPNIRDVFTPVQPCFPIHSLGNSG